MFITTFKDAYLRNNRRGGQKNLRCFPECSERGHRCSGFCGRAVQVRFPSEQGGGENQCSYCFVEGKELVSLAEFVTLGKEGTDIFVGSTFPVDHFEMDTRCKKAPLRRFVRGIPDEKKKNIFSYKPSCWHYSWRSNKHATDTLHFLRVVTFEVDRSTSTMTCVSSIDTTKFTLFSSKILDKETSKRKRSTPAKSTAKMPAKKSKKSSSPRPPKKVKRSNTIVQEPKVLSNAPTEEMNCWANVCPPSPVSVTLFDDDIILNDSYHADLSLDALLLQLDCNPVNELRPAKFATTPALNEFSTIEDDNMAFDNTLFSFDPMLDVF
jgi:hypothetical protein